MESIPQSAKGGGIHCLANPGTMESTAQWNKIHSPEQGGWSPFHS